MNDLQYIQQDEDVKCQLKLYNHKKSFYRSLSDPSSKYGIIMGKELQIGSLDRDSMVSQSFVCGLLLLLLLVQLDMIGSNLLRSV